MFLRLWLVASNNCPKVYIPNLGHDPEQIGMTMDSSIQTLLRYLRANAGPEYKAARLLNFVLFDSRHENHLGPVSVELLCELGVQLIDTELVSTPGAALYDPELLVSALLSLT